MWNPNMNNNIFNESKKNFQKNVKKTAKGVKKVVIIVAAGVAAVFIVSGSFYQIQEQEQAVLTTLGKPKAVTETGLHFKIPGIQQVKKVNTTIQGFPIGYTIENNQTVDTEGIMITSDYNFINVDFFVEYRIAEPVQYLYASQRPEDILKSISQSCIRTVIGSYKVDDVLTTGKSEIQAKIKEMIITKIEDQNLGLQLVNITIQDSAPPTQEVMQAFKAMYEEYQKNPVVTKQRMFYETMESVLPGLKIVIDSGNGVQKVLPLAPFTENDTSAANGQKPEKDDTQESDAPKENKTNNAENPTAETTNPVTPQTDAQ